MHVCMDEWLYGYIGEGWNERYLLELGSGRVCARVRVRGGGQSGKDGMEKSADEARSQEKDDEVKRR